MAFDRREIEDFIYHEARLCDEQRGDEWLQLWSDDALYWVPANRDDIDPTREVSFIYDDRRSIGDRVDRLKQGLAFAQDPASRMRRMLSNIEVDEEENGDLTVQANFMVIELRRRQQNTWAGRMMYRLRRENGDLKMAVKKIMLINNDEEIPGFQFLL